MQLLIIAACIFATANGYGFQRPANPSPVENPQVPQKPIESWTGGFHSLKPWTAPEASASAQASASSNSQSVSAPANIYFPTEQAATSTSHNNPAVGAPQNAQQHSVAHAPNQHAAPPSKASSHYAASPAQAPAPPAKAPSQHAAAPLAQTPKQNVAPPTKASSHYTAPSAQAPARNPVTPAKAPNHHAAPPAKSPSNYAAPPAQAPAQNPASSTSAPNHPAAPPAKAPSHYAAPPAQVPAQNPAAPTPNHYNAPSTQAPAQNPASSNPAPNQPTKAPNHYAAPSAQAPAQNPTSLTSAPNQPAAAPSKAPNHYAAPSAQAPAQNPASSTSAPNQPAAASSKAPNHYAAPSAQAPAQNPASSTSAPNHPAAPSAMAPSHYAAPPGQVPAQNSAAPPAPNQPAAAPSRAPYHYAAPSAQASPQHTASSAKAPKASPIQAPSPYPAPSAHAPAQPAAPPPAQAPKAPTAQASYSSGSVPASAFPQKWNLTESNSGSQTVASNNQSPQKPSSSGYKSSEKQNGKDSNYRLPKESGETTPNTQEAAQTLTGNNYHKPSAAEASTSTSEPQAPVHSETTSGYHIPSSDSQTVEELPSPSGSYQMQNNAGISQSHSKSEGYDNAEKPTVPDVTAPSVEHDKNSAKYPMETKPVATNGAGQQPTGTNKPAAQQVTTPATNGYQASSQATTQTTNTPTTTQSPPYYGQYSTQLGSDAVATSYDSQLTQLSSKNEELNVNHQYDNGPQTPLNLSVIDSVTTSSSAAPADVTSSVPLSTEVNLIQTYYSAPVESTSSSASQSTTISAGSQNYLPPLTESSQKLSDSSSSAGYGIYQEGTAGGQNTQQVSATASATVSQTAPQSTPGASDIYQASSASGSAISEVLGNYFQSPPTGESGNGASTNPLPSQHETTVVGAFSHNHQAISQGSSSNGNNGGHGKPSVAIITSESILNKDGSFSYNFESEDGIKVEASGLQKQVGPKPEDVGTVSKGSYSYMAPDGAHISVKWVADEKGFQPVGDHLPTPPPVPSHVAQLLADMSANVEHTADGSYPLPSDVAQPGSNNGDTSYSEQSAEGNYPLPSTAAQSEPESYPEQPAKLDQSSHAY